MLFFSYTYLGFGISRDCFTPQEAVMWDIFRFLNAPTYASVGEVKPNSDKG